MEINVADPLVPHVDVRFDLLSFIKHSVADVIRLEDKHPPFSAPLHNDFAFFFYEAAVVSEPNLHALIDDLFDRY